MHARLGAPWPLAHRNALCSTHSTHPSDYLLLTLSSGCEPTNRLYYVDLKALPRDKAGVLGLATYDRRKGESATPLPIVKLVDNFEASWDYVANEGPVFTFHTNFEAPRNR
jgi:prolyl oligopeptidase